MCNEENLISVQTYASAVWVELVASPISPLWWSFLPLIGCLCCTLSLLPLRCVPYWRLSFHPIL